ncbi:hypothetical protein CLIB1444_01S12134 [[Candida] jaroonii]|uniref:Uncharacterized protein n=1 Tax=[Candida] jaroonii TaxID=467808 RepID=A0ACA9Y148_9ASCO|nr:hypothetical protein CLIB1444_01S12134 [[Candida] jaroonii]
MSKEDILNINKSQYKSWINKVENSNDEISGLCINLVEIIEDNLLKDHKLIAHLLSGLSDEVRSIILDGLRKKYQSNHVKLSFIETLVDSSNVITQNIIIDTFEKIIQGDHSDDEKVQMVLNYSRKLCDLQTVNKSAISLNTDWFNELLDIIPEQSFAVFYSTLVNLNIKTKHPKYKTIIEKLSKGSNSDKFVLRSGIMDPTWGDTNKEIKGFTKQRILHYFSFDKLISFYQEAYKRNDLADCNLYLELSVKKFEMECDKYELEGSNKEYIGKHFEDIIKYSMMHLMMFKNPHECLRILKYLNDNQIPLKFKFLNTLIKSLRQRGYYKEAILVINNIKLDNLDADSRSNIVSEIFQITNKVYGNKFEIILGYAIKMFKLKNNDSIEPMLRELGLLQGSVDLANVDGRLSGLYLTQDHLYEIYRSFFINNKGLKYYKVLEMFEKYLHHLQHSPMKVDQVNDKILTLFLNYLNKTNPYDNKFILFQNSNNFEVSQKIAYDFLDTFPQAFVKPYLFEILINQALSYNNFNLAAELIKRSRALNLPFTFFQIYPFIKYHYQQGQISNAKIWYDLMIDHKVKATNIKSNEIFKIAKELGWDNNNYKNQQVYKTRAKKRMKENFKNDGLKFIKASKIPGSSFEEKLSHLLKHIE